MGKHAKERLRVIIHDFLGKHGYVLALACLNAILGLALLDSLLYPFGYRLFNTFSTTGKLVVFSAAILFVTGMVSLQVDRSNFAYSTVNRKRN